MKSIKNKKINNKKTKKVNKNNKLYKNLKGGAGNPVIDNPDRIIERELDKDIDKFTGVANLNFKKYDSNPPVTGLNKVYFFLEKLNDINFEFWNNYNKYQYFATERNGTKLHNGSYVKDVSDGISAFKKSLDLYRNNNTGINNIIDYDIWIAYACKDFIDTNASENPSPIINNLSDLPANILRNDYKYKSFDLFNRFNLIEITVTMFIDKNSPITTHMGISKNFLYFGYYKNFRINSQLSLYLHSFIAKVSNYIYPENKKKIYMVTNPNIAMRSILYKGLSDYVVKKQIDINDIIIIGNNKNRAFKNKKSLQNKSADKGINLNNKSSYGYIRPISDDKSILHNIDDKNWSITYKGQDIEFEKPLWFKHPHLNNHLSTTIIDIEHLGNLYFADYNFVDYR